MKSKEIFIEQMQGKLKKFKSEGRNFDEITTSDEVYRFAKNARILKENGQYYTLEEKFALVGIERKPERAVDIEEKIREQIEEYRKSGGDFHIARKKLPFYDSVWSYIKKHARRTGETLTFEDVLKGKFGCKEYSDTYARFHRILDIEKYVDEDGFADGYRQDEQMASYISSAAQTLGVSSSVVILLFCDKSLREVWCDSDLMEHLISGLSKYQEENGSLKNLKRKSPQLYERLRRFARYAMSSAGEELGVADCLEILGFESDGYKIAEAETKDISKTMQEIFDRVKENGGKVRLEDLTKTEYRTILNKANRLGVSTKAIFKVYNLDYVSGNNNPRFAKIKVTEYPFMREMRKRRDEIVAKSNISLDNGNTKEEVFEIWMKACLEAYKEFYEIKPFNKSSQLKVVHQASRRIK